MRGRGRRVFRVTAKFAWRRRVLPGCGSCDSGEELVELLLDPVELGCVPIQGLDEVRGFVGLVGVKPGDLMVYGLAECAHVALVGDVDASLPFGNALCVRRWGDAQLAS